MVLMIENKLDKMIDELSEVIPYDFGLWDSEELDIESDIYNVVRDYFPDAYIAYGVSKMAIVTKALPYVIKVPFNGTWSGNGGYEWSDELEDYIQVPEENEFYSFRHADNLDIHGQNENYCADELAKYEIAEDAHLEEFFAETKFYKKVGNTYFYLQERVVEYNNSRSSLNRETVYEINEKYQEELNYTRLAADWLVEAILCYGFLAVKTFLEFLDEWHLDDDLHYGNYGYREDGRPVLIDWAGWRD